MPITYTADDLVQVGARSKAGVDQGIQPIDDELRTSKSKEGLAPPNTERNGREGSRAHCANGWQEYQSDDSGSQEV